MPNEARPVVSIALLVYLIGVFLLSLFPLDQVDWAKAIVMVMCVISAIGLIAHTTPGIVIPGERYAYLVCGYAGFSTALLYLVDTNDSSGRRFAVSFLLMSGAFGGYGAYLVEQREG